MPLRIHLAPLHVRALARKQFRGLRRLLHNPRHCEVPHVGALR